MVIVPGATVDAPEAAEEAPDVVDEEVLSWWLHAVRAKQATADAASNRKLSRMN